MSAKGEKTCRICFLRDRVRTMLANLAVSGLQDRLAPLFSNGDVGTCGVSKLIGEEAVAVVPRMGVPGMERGGLTVGRE